MGSEFLKNGEWHQRVANDQNDPLFFQQTGSYVVDTIVDAESLAASDKTSDFDMGITTESEVWVAISIDQQPWTARTTRIWGGDASSSLYPERNGESSTYGGQTPATSLFLGINAGGTYGLSDIASMEEAKAHANPFPEKINITNESSSTATVTVKVLRVWR